MSDDFDEIVNNQPEGEDSDAENILEDLAKVWGKHYPGIFVSGVVIAEYIDSDGDRVMRFVSSPDMTPWQLLGMLESARLDAQHLSQCATVDDRLFDPDDDEE